MYTITIENGSSLDWLYINDEWKDYVCEDFDENVVLTGNDRNISSIEKASWWIEAKNLIDEMDNIIYYSPNYSTGEITDSIDEFIDTFKRDVDPDTLKKCADAYIECRYSDDPDFVMTIAKLLHPELSLEMSELHGYTQSEWVDAIYNSANVNEDVLEAYVMGMLTEIHVESDNGEDFWDTIMDDELWKVSNYKDFFRARYDIPADEEIKVRKVSGYHQVADYEDVD